MEHDPKTQADKKPLKTDGYTFRLCDKAILDDDAASLARAAGSKQLPLEMAMAIAAQAWGLNFANGDRAGHRLFDWPLFGQLT
jgi:hypothetical protein